MKSLALFESDLTSRPVGYLEAAERLLVKTVKAAEERVYEANRRLMAVRREMEKRVKP